MFLRQGGRGQQVPPIPPVYEYEEYRDYGEVYQDYGETYQDSEEENPQVNLSDVDAYKREEDSYGRGRDNSAQREDIEETYVAQITDDQERQMKENVAQNAETCCMNWSIPRSMRDVQMTGW